MKTDFVRICRDIFLAATIGIGSTACTTWDPKPRDSMPNGIANGYSRSLDASVKAQDKWWKSFRSEQLNQLVDDGLGNNLDVAAAWARLRQAEAAAAKAGAARSPNASVEFERGVRTTIDAGKAESVNNYSFGLGLSYELDLWGKVRAGTKAAALNRQVSQADVEATALSLSGQIADVWIQLIQTQAEISVIKAQIATNTKRQEILRNRQRKAQATALDVYQQEQALEATKLALPPLEQRQQLLLDQLALLRGKSPGSTKETFSEALPKLPTFPEVGVPADLLARRPDVRSAFLSLQSADWDVTAAKADRLPSLSLTGSLGAESEHLNQLFDDWLARLAGSLVAPLLDGGRRKAEVARSQAVVDERMIRYRKVVLNAVHEVEAAIIKERHQLRLQEKTQRQLELARRTLAEAEKRYRNALIDYITVLSSLTSLQRLERDLLSIDASLLRNRITLYKALGGNWPSEMKPPAKPENEQESNE